MKNIVTHSRRIPIGYSNSHHRVLLTLIGHTGPHGLVTTCSWTNIMDYAGIGKQSEAQTIVSDLHEIGLVTLVKSGTRSPNFQLHPGYESESQIGTSYLASQMPRVNELRTRRTQAHIITKNGRNGIFQDDDIIITDLNKEIQTDATKSPRWKFSVVTTDGCTIKNCIVIIYPGKQAYIAGPSKYVKDTWVSLVDFNLTLEEKIRMKILNEIDALP